MGDASADPGSGGVPLPVPGKDPANQETPAQVPEPPCPPETDSWLRCLQAERMGRREVAFLGAYFILLTPVLIGSLAWLWPDGNTPLLLPWPNGIGGLSLSEDIRLLLLCVFSGGLGATLHGANSLVNFVGNRRLVRSWMLWYVLRPFIGNIVGVVLFSVLKGGLLLVTVKGGEVTPNSIGVVGVATLAGMFSEQAVEKLRATFEGLLSAPKPGRKDA